MRIEFCGVWRLFQPNCLVSLPAFQSLFRTSSSVAGLAFKLPFHVVVQVIDDLVLQVLVLLDCLLHVAQNFEDVL